MTDKIEVPRELLERLLYCAKYSSDSAPLEAEALLREAAQPDPDQVSDESVRKSWARFSDALVRGPDVPLPGMIEAFESHYSQDFRDKEWRREAATWAAAWKACLNRNRPTDEELRRDSELVDYVLQDDIHNRLTPRVVDIAYSAFRLGRCGKNNDDGGPCDWFNDTKPMVMDQIAKIRAAIAAEQKADQ